MVLAHGVVLARLKDMDYSAITACLDSKRLEQLKADYPIGKSTVVAYNDFGYALAEAGQYDEAYRLLAEVERSYSQ